MYKLLKELTSIQSVSGEEKFIFQFIKNRLTAEKIRFTELQHGDIFLGKKNPKLLLTAHADEVGFKITKINEDGTCDFEGVGWVYPWLFPGRIVQARTNKNSIFHGLVLYEKEFDKKISSWKKLKIDFGMDKKEMLKAGFKAGCFGSYHKNFFETRKKIIATALDNRLGVAILMELAKKYYEYIENGTVGIAFTADEEMHNMGGRATIKYAMPEHLCIVDVCPKSLAGKNTKNLDLKIGPYILYKTLDYKIPKTCEKILKGIRYVKISSNNKYLKKSEPKIFQGLGVEKSINLLFPVSNYHHGAYTCYKSSIEGTRTGLEFVIKRIIR